MDADSITISIRTVDDSGPVLQQVETRILGVGTAASSTTQLMRGLGTAGSGTTAEFNALRSAIEANTSALNSFHGNLPRANQELGHMHGNMRLVSGTAREFGLNLGYSMRSFLAESPAVITAIRAMEGGFVAMGAIEIGEQVVEGVQKLYEKWIDVNAAYDEYAKSVKENADADVVNVHSLETAEARLDSVNKKFKDLMDTGRSLHGLGLGDIATAIASGNVMALGQGAGEVASGKDLGTQGVKAGQQGDKLSAERIRQEQELTTAQIEAAHAGDGRLGTESRITAELQKQFDLNNENRKFEQQMDRLQGNQTPRDAGTQMQVARDQAAQAKADAASELETRKQTGEVIRMQNEALNAGMRGEALHDEERQQAIDAVTRRFQQGEISKQTAAAETEALDMKFHNQKMMRLEDEEYATKKLQEQASQAGLTGIPKIQAETQSRIDELTQNPANAGLPDDEVKKRTSAYQQIGSQQIVEAQQQFADKIAQISERSNDQMTAGLARVAASEKNSITELERAYTEFYGADQAKWQGYQDAKTSIEQGAERERQKLSEDVDRQISQTEAEAARALLPPWEAAQQEIEDDYQQRLQKIREDVEQHVVTEEQGAREVKAAWDAANSEMERATMQERDRLAGQLSSFFDNPSKYMQQRAKQVMFDIMANWMQQVEQTSPRLQGMIGGIFGQNPVGTGSPQHALGQMFGAHAATHGADQSGLTNASSTLISAGSTLSSSGTMLASSAAALTQAATVWESALYNGGGGAGGGSSFSGWTGESSGAGGGDVGSDSFWLGGGGTSGGGGGIFGGGGASPSFGGAGGGGGVGALSETLGIPPQLASMIPGAQAISSTLGLYQGFSKLLSSSGSGGGAQLLNSSGGFQPSDINQAPTNSAGVLGTVPGGASSDDNGSAGSNALGEIGGIATGGMTAFSGLSAAWNSSNIGSGLIGAGETALGGAEMGTAIMPGIGTAIGAAVGFGLGLAADLFGDHGRSKAQHYNTMTVVPTLQQLMDSFSSGGGDYDQASVAMNNLQIQAQKQTAQWGSGAVDFYHSTILPEITNAESQVSREGAAGRANVTTTAAQFHGGGWIDDFLDLATSDSEGFIHARQGEYMMHDAAASTNAPWLEAMNRGLNLTAALAPVLSPAATPRETGSASTYLSAASRGGSAMGGPGGSGSPLHVHVHAWDSRDVNRWLRGGGAMQIQTELNRNTSRYAGKALSS